MDLTKLDWQDLLMWRQKSELLYEKNLQIKELLMETYIGFICLYLKGTIAGSILCAVTSPYRGQQKKIHNNKRYKKSIWI